MPALTDKVIRMPLYLQVKKKIEEMISDGVWLPDTAIPSEAKLGATFGVSIGTVRRAVDELVEQNHLIRKQGSGTYVKSYRNRVYWHRFQRFQSSTGQLLQWTSRLEKFERIIPPKSIASALDIDENTPVIYMTRKLESLPPFGYGGYDEIYLCVPESTTAAREMFERVNGSLYAAYEEQMGIVITDVTDKAQFVLADETDCIFDDLPPNTPIIRLTRLSRTFGKKPIEYRIERVRAQGIQMLLD